MCRGLTHRNASSNKKRVADQRQSWNYEYPLIFNSIFISRNLQIFFINNNLIFIFVGIKLYLTFVHWYLWREGYRSIMLQKYKILWCNTLIPFVLFVSVNMSFKLFITRLHPACTVVTDKMCIRDRLCVYFNGIDFRMLKHVLKPL